MADNDTEKPEDIESVVKAVSEKESGAALHLGAGLHLHILPTEEGTLIDLSMKGRPRTYAVPLTKGGVGVYIRTSYRADIEEKVKDCSERARRGLKVLCERKTGEILKDANKFYGVLCDIVDQEKRETYTDFIRMAAEDTLAELDDDTSMADGTNKLLDNLGPMAGVAIQILGAMGTVATSGVLAKAAQFNIDETCERYIGWSIIEQCAYGFAKQIQDDLPLLDGDLAEKTKALIPFYAALTIAASQAKGKAKELYDKRRKFYVEISGIPVQERDLAQLSHTLIQGVLPETKQS